MNIQSHPLPPGHSFGKKMPKKYVVWHGTGGRTSHTPLFGQPRKATATIDVWRRNADQRGAPWVVDRDGSIYSTFDDSGWIYHLGLAGTRGQFDRESVAIELANEGPLLLDGSRLHAFGTVTPQTVYTGPFVDYHWRGHRYFAQPDPEQVDAAVELTLDVCRRHGIEPLFFYPSTHYAFPRCFQVATIVCHSNCSEQDTDLCLPEWVFEKIEAAGIRLVS